MFAKENKNCEQEGMETKNSKKKVASPKNKEAHQIEKGRKRRRSNQQRIRPIRSWY